MAQRASSPAVPAGEKTERAPGTSARHLSGAVERMLIRHLGAASALQALTLQPMGEAAFRPVLTRPPEPGAPLNIRVSDPSEDTIFGNRTAQSEPSLAVNGHTIIVGFNDSTPIGSFAGLANSLNLGQVFSDDGALTPADESGNPSLTADGQGRFFCAAAVANFHTQESWIGVSHRSEEGLSFPAPVKASGTQAAPGRTFEDKPWLIVDRSEAGTRGNLYLCWTRFEGFDWSTGQADQSRILFARSGDGGATWSAPEALTGPRPPFGPQGVVAVVDPEGRLFTGWFDRDGNRLEFRCSTDGGRTFFDPVAEESTVSILAPLGDTVNGNLRADNFLSLAVDPGHGTLYGAFSARPEQSTADVFLVRSLDHGRHWSSPVRVNDDGTATDQWLPSVAVTADGVVGVMFFDRRNDPADNLNIDVYLALSVDRGASFLPNRRITTASFPPPIAVDPCFGAQHLGDRNHLAAQGERFFLVWGDNRDFVGRRNDPNIYFATMGTQDCYLRDDPSDDGAVPRSGMACVSPDIAPAQECLVPEAAEPVNVTVRNRGALLARNAQVRLCWSDPATHVPAHAWRSDHITVDGEPTNQQRLGEVPPGGSIATPSPFLWTPPAPSWAPGQGHFCLCAQVDSPGDPVTFPSGGAEGIRRDNNLAVRSVHAVELGRRSVPLRFLVAGDSERFWLADLVLDARALPAGWRAELTLPEGILWYARFEGLVVVRRQHEGPPGREDRRGAPDFTDARMLETFERLNVTFEFEPGHVARILDVELPPGSRHLAELTLHPGTAILELSRSALRVQQLVNHTAVGGLLYHLLPGKA